MAWNGTVADLERRELGTLQKNFGEEPSGGDELDLVTQLQANNEKLAGIMQEYANVRTRMVGRLSEGAKAAASMLGQDLTKRRHHCENENMRLQRELIAKRKSQKQSIAKSSFSGTRANLAVLQQCMNSVNSGMTKLSEADRKRLRISYGIAQDLVDAGF